MIGGSHQAVRAPQGINGAMVIPVEPPNPSQALLKRMGIFINLAAS